jgi:RND family efflux transporter MFP subunit
MSRLPAIMTCWRRVGAFLGLALMGLPVGCKGKTPIQGPAGLPVKIEVAQAVTVDDTTEYVASLKSRDSASIMPQVEGQVTGIFVHSGERVDAGTPLLEIDPAKQQATVKSQEDTRAAKLAALDYARRHHERVRGLFASGVASQQDLDQAKSALDAAEADLRSMEAQVAEQEVQLRYHRVAAPTAGIVGDIPVRVGDRVTVSTLLTTVDKPGTLEAYVSVPVERAPQLRMGMPVRIVDSAGATVADSRVTFISPQADKETQTVLVKARIDNLTGTLRTAQFTRARVVWGTRQGPVVPLLAVSRISGQHFAFVAEGKEGALVARQRPLRLGEIVGNAYVVLDGIKAGERVIVSGTQFLQDGAPVSPQG